MLAQKAGSNIESVFWRLKNFSFQIFVYADSQIQKKYYSFSYIKSQYPKKFKFFYLHELENPYKNIQFFVNQKYANQKKKII